MSEIKLKPCPFCGGEASVNRMYREWDKQLYTVVSVGCKSCGCYIDEPYRNNKELEVRESKIIQTWNRRDGGQ